MANAGIIIVPPEKQEPHLPQVDLPVLPVPPPPPDQPPVEASQPSPPIIQIAPAPAPAAPQRALPETVVEAPPVPPLSERVRLFRDLPSVVAEGPPMEWDGDRPLLPVSPSQDSAAILRSMADQVRALADDAATKVEPPRNHDHIMAIMEMIRRDAMRRGATEEQAQALAEQWRERVQRFSPGRMAVNAVIGAANNLASMAADAVSAAMGRSEPIRAPSIPTVPGVGTAEQVATKFGEALVAFALGRGAGMGNIAAGALADASFDPTEGGLVSLLRSLGIAEETLEALDSRVAEDATTWERLRGRLMQVGEGMIVAAAVAGLIPLIARAFGQRGQAAAQPAGSPPPAAQQAVDDMQPPVAAADQAPPAPSAQAAAQADGAPTPVVQADTTGQSGQFIPPGVNATDNLPPASAQLTLPTTKGATGSITANGQTVAEVRLDEALAKDPGEGIIVFHGSPYVFDRFDFSKIGTGEGAQAYGYGLYFAEAEGVARSYRPTNMPYFVFNGWSMPENAFLDFIKANELMYWNNLHYVPTNAAAVDAIRAMHDDVVKGLIAIRDAIARRDFDEYLSAVWRVRDITPFTWDKNEHLRNYKEAVIVAVDGGSPRAFDGERPIGRLAMYASPNNDQAIPVIRETFEKMSPEENLSYQEAITNNIRQLNEFMDFVNTYAGALRVEEHTGALYRVRLNVDEDKLIHYDKFHDQPDDVLNALMDMAIDAAHYFDKWMRPEEITDRARMAVAYFMRRGYEAILSDRSMPRIHRAAAAVNQLLTKSHGHIVPVSAKEAATLRDYGIQGVKYLDGNSRALGEGTYNYVVFDDKFATILERYAVIPVAGVAASEALNAAQAED